MLVCELVLVNVDGLRIGLMLGYVDSLRIGLMLVVLLQDWYIYVGSMS